MAELEQMEIFEFTQRKVIKGYPELIWTGKRPYKSTQYFPAQLKETYGESTNGWLNKIFWGDNLQVMSHLLKQFRGQVDLIYIDPPFDSKADYKKKIRVKGKSVSTDSSTFEEKQYGDIWTNDEYLQFMYERFILFRELLSDNGSLYVHCDYRASHFLRMILEEVFGKENYTNEIVWSYATGGASKEFFGRKHDTIHYVRKNTKEYVFNPNDVREQRTEKSLKRAQNPNGARISSNDTTKLPTDVWGDIQALNPMEKERTDYPTQKPEALLEKIILASSNPGDIVFDCFMGSGTTQAVAMKLGRRFIGADINLGAIQTTTKRLLGIAEDLNSSIQDGTKYTGFEVYNVNNYDFFRNPIEARELLSEALEINAFSVSSVFDGEKDGRMVKIMPVNRIATKADLQELIANLPYKTYERRKDESPSQPVEKITFVCMGHEADLKAGFEQQVPAYKFDIEIVDILRDKADLQFKREAEVDVVRQGNKLIIKNFYPLNLMQKLSLQKEHVDNWKQLVESIMIDFNYDGAVLSPAVIDIPEKDELVGGIYTIPTDAGKIKIKITDLLSESLEVEV